MSTILTEPNLTLKEAVHKARKMYLGGYNCSEAILAVMGEAWFSDFNPSILRLATPFGGGVGQQADLCGCVSGAAMALGLLYGRKNLEEDDSRCTQLTQLFHERFQERFGSTSCDFFTKGKFTKINHLRCYRLVRNSVEILWEIVEESLEHERTAFV